MTLTEQLKAFSEARNASYSLDHGDDDDDDDDDDIYYDAVSVCLCATKNHHFLPTSELSAGGRK